MGEGAGALVLETLDSAIARNAKIYCEIIGFLVGLSWFISGYIGAESIEKEIQVQALSYVYPSADVFFWYCHVPFL